MEAGFDFTANMRSVIDDMVDRLDELDHIDTSRVAISFSQARNDSPYGLYAALTPMRFEQGSPTTLRHGRRYTAQRLLNASRQEVLYILTFCLPRFMDIPFAEKVVTVLHELWHISPQFNGDIRRHPGRCYAHSASQKNYDAKMKVLADRWLASDPPREVFEFLRLNFSQLRRIHGSIYGTRIRHPKLIPLSA